MRKQCSKFRNSSLVELLMEPAFIAAMGSIGFEDVAVTGFELFKDSAFVDDTRAAVIGEAG